MAPEPGRFREAVRPSRSSESSSSPVDLRILRVKPGPSSANPAFVPPEFVKRSELLLPEKTQYLFTVCTLLTRVLTFRNNRCSSTLLPPALYANPLQCWGQYLPQGRCFSPSARCASGCKSNAPFPVFARGALFFTARPLQGKVRPRPPCHTQRRSFSLTHHTLRAPTRRL